MMILFSRSNISGESFLIEIFFTDLITETTQDLLFEEPYKVEDSSLIFI
jgi:hypothetical protein